jgi:plastocyanin domain-containing protein
MGVYALGTVPLMLGLGNIVSLITQEKIQQVMKFSGAVVVVLGLLTINRSFANFGENAVNKPAKSNAVVSETAEESDKIIPYQAVKMDLTYQGYVPSTLTVKKGIPVRWIINVKEMSGCTNEIIMPAYNIKKKLQYGENVIEFTPRDVGEIKFSCWMKMVWGKFIVVGGDESVSNSVPVETASVAKLPEETDVLDSGSGQAGCGCGQNQ